MATTQLSDIIVPPVFLAYVTERTTELSALRQSGIIVANAEFNALAQGPASFFDMPHFSDLGNDEANIGSDDPAEKSVPKKIGTGKATASKHFRNQSWSSMDLTSAMLAADPMRVIGDLVAAYWDRQEIRVAIASLKGVIADNVANDAGDMVFDVTVRKTGAPTDTPDADNRISAEVVLLGKQTMGDAAGDLVAIAMHSVIFTNLQRQQLIVNIPNARGEVNIPTYLGYRVIVDDICPVEMVSGKPEYTTYLFGANMLGYGEGSPKVPVAVTRDEAAGNGEGQETLHNRKHFILTPAGVSFTRATMADASPTNAELALPANWNRVYDRKKIRFVALKTNG